MLATLLKTTKKHILQVCQIPELLNCFHLKNGSKVKLKELKENNRVEIENRDSVLSKIVVDTV